MNASTPGGSPLLDHDHDEPPVFLPANLLEGARRQKGLRPVTVPRACLLDFDGELVEHLVRTGRCTPEPDWPCFHSRLYRWRWQDREFGIVGGTVGAPFAVLVAEELFALGCRALVSISSAGLVAENLRPPFFLLIERALRDEGTSHHYLPPSPWVEADADLLAAVETALEPAGRSILRGASWTTDAPFREPAGRISDLRAQGVISVEMEAAALLSMAKALGCTVACIAHITNAMATRDDDFDKGDDGHESALDVCARALDASAARSERVSR